MSSHTIFRCFILMTLGAGIAAAQGTPPPPPSDTQETQAPAQKNPPLTEAQSKTTIESALEKQLPSQASSITVSTTKDNDIQLDGTVATAEDKVKAEQAAESAAPNQKIIDNLVVSNSPSEPSGANIPSATGEAAQNQNANPQPSPLPQSDVDSSSGVQSSITSALHKEPSLSASSITVNVTPNAVELAGTVNSAADRQTASDIARAKSGNRKVVNHITVEKPDPRPPRVDR